MPEQTHTIALVGAGKMGSALLSGWLRGQYENTRFIVLEPAPSDSLRKLDDSRVTINPDTDQTSPVDLAVVAVKPQILPEVMGTIQSICSPQTIVVSVAAGKTIAEFEAALGSRQPVIRTMPNTPSIVGKGISALFANQNVSMEGKALAEDLMASVGQVVWLDREDQMDAVTAVSGSGPAYVFHLTEAIAEAAMAQGLSNELAQTLAHATVSGAGALMDQSSETPAILRENVTSPGGTTAAALHILMQDDALKSLMKQAIEAATVRSKELGK